jgi:hypothetical protein
LWDLASVYCFLVRMIEMLLGCLLCNCVETFFNNVKLVSG